jgi:hypothetical protein
MYLTDQNVFKFMQTIKNPYRCQGFYPGSPDHSQSLYHLSYFGIKEFYSNGVANATLNNQYLEQIKEGQIGHRYYGTLLKLFKS